jgi:NAD(P)-dependent dehydrogenase (short-subunit alcohol dehydrogenase family)
MAMQRLAGKAAIVTGSGVGIGRHLALAFAREGAFVVVADIQEAGVRETARLIGDEFGSERVLPIITDLSAADAPAQVVAACMERYGRLDGIVNNAASQDPASLSDASDAHWEKVQTINVTTPMRLCRTALPYLAAPGGFIVNLSSLVGSMAIPERLAYNTSKTAIAGLTRALAVELGPRGIRVNAIAPGHIMSFGEEHWRQSYTERQQKVMATSYALCRVGRPEEVASVAVFLASDESSFITGQTLYVDGGMSILCPETAVFRAAEVTAEP